MTCNVCQGDRKLRLPTYATLASVGGPDIVDIPSLDPGYEEFPCPKCGPLRVPVERIGTIKVLSTIREDNRKQEGYVDHVKHDLAAAVGREMMKNNWIDFEEQFDNYSGNTMLRATAYTAHPDIGRKAVSSVEPEIPKPRIARPMMDTTGMKITIEFESEPDRTSPATVEIGGVRYDAVVVDCSVRGENPLTYRTMGGRIEYVKRSNAFDLSVDLKCGGLAGSPAPPAQPEPVETRSRDPFAREIDIE